MVETLGKVLVTSGYTDYAKKIMKPGQKYGPQITCNIFVVTSKTLQNLIKTFTKPTAAYRKGNAFQNFYTLIYA